MNKKFTIYCQMLSHQFWISSVCCLMLCYWTGQAIAQPSGKHGPQEVSYPVPAGAYFVSPGGTGGVPCSEGNPCSLSTALQKAPRGTTIVLKGGTYRTSKYNTTISRQLTLQPYPGATVILKGSEVKRDWVASGNVWKGNWAELRGKPNDDDGRAVGLENPMADHRDMIYINGQSQKQVSSLSEVGPGKFYADYAANMLYIGTDPSSKTVEVSAEWWGLSTYNNSETGVVIRGLKLMHYFDAGIFIGSPGTVVENNEVSWNGAAGIRVQYANDVVLKNNLFAYNACQGGGIAYADRIKMIGNSFVENNYEDYNRNSWSASGVKILWTQHAEVRDNLFLDNDANGIWLDARANDAIIVNNFVKNNSRNGIHCEISNDAIIAGNVVVESGKNEKLQGTGISVANSAGVKVFNNTLHNNEIALDVVEFTRHNGDPNDPFITRNTVVKNNILSEAFITEYPSALYHMKKKDCADETITEQDHNAYYRSTAGVPGLAVRWKVNNNSCGDEERLVTVQEFRNKFGYEQHGFGIQGGDDPFFISANNDNYDLKSTSLAIKSGAALPADVATALGWEKGVAVDIGAFQTDFSPSASSEVSMLPWIETFTTSDRSIDDNGLSDGSAWNLDNGSMSSNAFFKVKDNRLQARGTVGEGSWKSEKINIEGHLIDLSLMLYSQGELEENHNYDYVKVYYKVDGIEYLLKEVKGNIAKSGMEVSISEIIGKELEVIVKFRNSDYTEFYFLDDVKVISAGSTTPKAEITDISLVSKESTSALTEFDLVKNNVELDKSMLTIEDLDIHVEVEGNPGSVVFSFNGVENYTVDNEAPYSLHGDISSELPMGMNTVEVAVYSEADGEGVLLSEESFTFIVKQSMSYESADRWFEDFVLPKGTMHDTGTTAWSIDASHVTSSNPLFYIENNSLRLSETSAMKDKGYVRWVSEAINIAGQPSAKIGFGAKHLGVLEDDLASGDYLNVYYKVDNQPLQKVLNMYGGFENENQWYQFEKGGIAGNKLQIIIEARTTTKTESYYIHHITVSEENAERPVQKLPWREDFAGDDNLMEQQDESAWFFSQYKSSDDEQFGVRDERLYFSDHENTNLWSSYPISIADAQSVKIGFDIMEVGVLESEGVQHDFIKVYYRIDKGEKQLLMEQNGNLRQPSTWFHIEQSGLIGDMLELFIEGKTTAKSESYYIDNITIEDEFAESDKQALPWIEDFAGADHLLSKKDETAWAFSWTEAAQDVIADFGVRDESLYISQNPATVSWTSEPIQIVTAKNVTVSFDIKETGVLESAGGNRDYLNVYYRINGGSLQPILEHNGDFEKDNQWVTIEKSGIQGETLEIVIQGKTTSESEVYYVDNISVTEAAEEVVEEETISKLTIYAAGKSGYETMELRIDGQTVMSWDGIGGNVYDPIYEEYVYEHKGEALKASQVQVVYVNDAGYHPYTGIRVDKIEIDGKTYETEASSTYGVGVYSNEDCQEGYMQSESLDCGGYFRFQASEIDNFFLEINAYPNPTQGLQTLEFTTNVDKLNVRIIDMYGKEWMKYAELNPASALQLDMSSLQAGIYILHVSSGSIYEEMRIYKE